MPVLHIEVGGDKGGIYFEPRDVLWKEDGVLISPKDDGGIMSTLGGMLKRGMAGVNMVLAQARGYGHTALTRGEAGCISAIPMAAGATVCLRHGAFLAATDGITCGFERIQGIGNTLLGGNGMFMGTFHAQRDGTLFVHGLGDTTVMELKSQAAIEAAQHGWLWKDGTVAMDTVTADFGNALMGSGSLLLHRFTGPGRVGLQSGRRITPEK